MGVPRIPTIGATLVWAALVVISAREIYGHETTEGPRSAAPESWPAESSIVRDAARPTIVMFIHPDCPCSRASLIELAATAMSGATVSIVFASVGDLWDRAGRIAGATRVLDPTAREASRFGAATSGHVVAYDATGVLRFAGGITGSRGHAGDNVGRRTVERIAAGSHERDLDHAVFGCVLR